MFGDSINHELNTLNVNACTNTSKQIFKRVNDELIISNSSFKIAKFCLIWNDVTFLPQTTQHQLFPHICNSTIPGTGWSINTQSNQIKKGSLCLEVINESSNDPKLWLSQCVGQDKSNKMVKTNLRSQRWLFKAINTEAFSFTDASGSRNLKAC